jgi:hypothetical protein
MLLSFCLPPIYRSPAPGSLSIEKPRTKPRFRPGFWCRTTVRRTLRGPYPLANMSSDTHHLPGASCIESCAGPPKSMRIVYRNPAAKSSLFRRKYGRAQWTHDPESCPASRCKGNGAVDQPSRPGHPGSRSHKPYASAGTQTFRTASMQLGRLPWRWWRCMAAATKPTNMGCGRKGHDVRQGWACVPMKNG